MGDDVFIPQLTSRLSAEFGAACLSSGGATFQHTKIAGLGHDEESDVELQAAHSFIADAFSEPRQVSLGLAGNVKVVAAKAAALTHYNVAGATDAQHPIVPMSYGDKQDDY